MFTTIFPPQIGGPATQCANLCRALVRREITPIVVTYGNTFSRNDAKGYRVYTYKRNYHLGPLDRIIRWTVFPFYIAYIFKKEKIQIVHCHSVNILSFIAARIAKTMGIPRIVKFAGDWVWETLSTQKIQGEDYREVYTQSHYARFLTRIEKKGLRLFNVIWTVSEFRKENIEFLLGKNANTVLIPNALLLDNKVFLNKPTDIVTLVSANRFIPHKRIAWMVEIYAEVATPNTRLVLIGGGSKEEEEKVRKTIKKNNLEHQVKITGVMTSEEVRKEFAEASLYLSTSQEEGLPNVFIEAMNYCLPIISSDAGGCREMVRDNETGYIIPIHNKEIFVEKVRELIENKTKREQFARNAFARSKQYDIEEKVTEFINLYKKLLQE
jgi:glycosyltransferase involved in cell wall biosynthesis